MKKILLTIIALAALFNNSYSQAFILTENFNNYDGTIGSIPANWSFTYTGSTSFYSTVSSSGTSGPNAYKFGVDSATIITPQFTGGDSLHFWTKGFSTNDSSALIIYYSTDLLNWSLLVTIDSIASSGVFNHYGLTAGTKQLKFVYRKISGNVAFDDFSVTQSNVGINNLSKNGKPFSVFPSPSSGPVQIGFDEPVQYVKFSIYNMIGNEIKNVPMEKISDRQYKFNFRNQQPGFYFLRIQTDKFNFTTRVTITAAVAKKPDAPDA